MVNKIRNAAFEKKLKKIEKGLGITETEKHKFVAVDHVIDTNKRSKMGDEPKFTE